MINCWIAAEHALRHIQKNRTQIDAAFSEKNIQKSEYALFAGFDESLIQDGIGYLEQIHIFTSVVILADPPFLAQLGKILSPFSSILFSETSHPHRLPVFKPDGSMWEFDELVFQTASKLADSGSTAASYPTVISLSHSSGGGATSGAGGSQESSGPDKERSTADNTDKKDDKDGEGEEHKGDKKGKDREEDPDDPEGPDDEPEGKSEPKLVQFDVWSDLHLNDHSGRFQLLSVAGDLTIQFAKHARAAECHVQFTKLNFGSIRTTLGTAYEQFFLRVTVDSRNQDARVNIVKPLQTCARDKGSKVVSASKSGWNAAAGAAASFSFLPLKPQATFTATGGRTGETSISTENMQYASQIDPQCHFGIASWGFHIDDPSHRTGGIQMPPTILPTMDFEFLSMPSKPINVPSIIAVEIKSYWTVISHSEDGFPWISGVFSPLKKTASPYSNLCQAVVLEIPSRLVRRADYMARLLVNIKDLDLGYLTNVRFADGPDGFSVIPAISRCSHPDLASVERASVLELPTLKYLTGTNEVLSLIAQQRSM